MHDDPPIPVPGHAIVEFALQAEGVQNALFHVIRKFVHRDLLAPSAATDLFGRRGDSFNVDQLAWLAAGISSSAYALAHMNGVARLSDSRALLVEALRQTELSGLFLEFGVFSGSTINVIAAECPEHKIYGFDSFEGLPEAWRPGFEAGMFRTPTLPSVAGNVELVVGWFDRTLPRFLDRFPDQTAAFIHIDCDLYSSAQCIFSQLKTKIRPGTVIVFDEYFNYPGWERHEYRAFQEFIVHTGHAYKYIGLVPSHQQVAVKIVS